MPPRPAPAPAARRLPARFHLWWTVSTLSATGDAMLAFALIWIATGHGPLAVALVSTLSVVPRILLTLLGGVLGDRHGPRRLLLVTTVVRLVCLAAFAGVSLLTTGIAFLALAAGVNAVVGAFQQPAAVVLPRLLIAHEGQFARALARISGSLHVARILGVGLGGLAITALPLAAILGLNALVVALSLLVLGVIRPRVDAGAAPAAPAPGTLVALAEGIRSVHALHLGPLLLAVALVCAAVLPAVAVVLPSMARSHGWSAGHASLLEAGWAAGTLAVTLLISATGTIDRLRIPLVGGPAVVCAALVALALPVGAGPAVALAVLVGAGTAVFTTHVAPTLLRQAPRDRMIRFQSLMTVVQLLPPALLNAPLAGLAGTGRVAAALLLAAGMAGAASLVAARGLDRLGSAAAHDRADVPSASEAR